MPGHASSPHWTAIDFDSEGEEDLPSPHSSGRVYLDPWDAGNPSYDSRESGHFQEENNDSFIGEPVSASFYYVPTKTYDSNEDNEAMEQTLYSARRHILPPYDMVDCSTFRRKSHYDYTDLHPEMTNNFGYDVLPLASPPRRRSMFAMEDPYHATRPILYESLAPQMPHLLPPYPGLVALPTRPQIRKRISLPVNRSDYGFLPELRKPNARRISRYTDPYERCGYEKVIPDYAEDYYRLPSVMNKPPPENFHLSRYGHLKIDYSISWNSLDRFIRNQ